MPESSKRPAEGIQLRDEGMRTEAKDPKTAGLPVVPGHPRERWTGANPDRSASSADLEEADRARAQEAGADGVCVRTPELLKAVDVLARVMSAASQGRPAGAR